MSAEDLVRLIFIITTLILSNIFSCEKIKLSGLAVAAVTNYHNMTMDNNYADLLCAYVWKCDGRNYDYTLSLIMSLVIMVVLERVFFLLNIFVHLTAVLAMNQDVEEYVPLESADA